VRFAMFKSDCSLAYEQTETAGGLVWLRGDELVSLSAEWRKYLSMAA
jgi:hypothetical protein